jgi:serine O-acetyltransferase
MISAEIPDWSREAYSGWNPGRALLASIRDYQRASARSGMLAGITRKLAAARHRFWSVISGADIPLTVSIGGGLLIPHPNGIVIHPDAIIGPNCLILQQVTLGTTHAGAPRVEGHVDIGAGAKLLGEIHVGAHVLIGANAVVLQDIPAGATAVGIPARVVEPTR